MDGTPTSQDPGASTSRRARTALGLFAAVALIASAGALASSRQGAPDATAEGASPAEGGAAGGKGSVSGTVSVLRDGERVDDASGVVVYLVGFDEDAPDDAATLVQEGLNFEPPVLPVTRGQEVVFPNRDFRITHNVFAHRPRFNLGQFRSGRGKPPSRRFEDLGPVEVYCNIHPHMAATILVLPNRRYAHTDPEGRFTIEGIPAGSWRIFAYDRFSKRPSAGEVEISNGHEATVAFEIERDRIEAPDHKRFDGTDYSQGHYP